ncbi:primosomal protein N' (replication factor Y) [Microbacteriaceae bacterium SG_E_30_P1]|uniref:Primosomal protein N' (Replication factor Y) n=1 Tax=Antiquaquibacter oligotrophicus TaxID=2880260 RepID=A0ABT6KNE5_9MICO|nr:primosomal protein N' [Antiquaquibacter oligotrophicus]MDH6180968.1 primosomal protein N' (replication factor Y) [Antiquaquibacter oligotrophicus]UDF13331.1 primosomal protein N' [Antiquaquibacter oligotrophicus]
MSESAIARVVVDSPLPQLDRLFDYSIPDALASEVVAGVRVKVPLRSAGRVADGLVVEVAERGGFDGPLSEIDSVVSPIPVLTPEVWRLARQAADRAAGSANDILRLAIPGRQVRVEKTFLGATESEPIPVVASPTVQHYGETIDSVVTDRSRIALSAVPGVTELRDGRWVRTWAVTLAQAAAACVARGDTAILVVPDYRDQNQVEAALAQYLPPELIIRADARQSNPDRYRGFLRGLGDTALAVVGNRSTVYFPAKRLGLIALWDDGDPLHAEPLAPYVHARDAALIRQEQRGCALIFASHSRSSEVQRLVELGWLIAVDPVRAAHPKVVPTAHQLSDDPMAQRARIPSLAWRTAREAVAHGPVLVQVARPGYSPRLACADCGQTARCLRCSGPLAQRSAGSTPSCSWCGMLSTSWSCSHCDGTRLRLVGAAGSTRTAEDLGRAFPGVRVIIADGEHPIEHVGSSPALVIATRGAEPIADGGYRAVLLLDGEQMIARESLRVAEDCLRWWSNAAALAAPGAVSVLSGVGGELATAMATWRQADFAARELRDRRMLRFPPAVRVATVTGTLAAVAEAIADLPVEPSDVLGPVDLGSATVRSIVRFDYSAGSEIASALRSELIRSASGRRSAARGGRPTTPALRVRLDDLEPFLES